MALIVILDTIALLLFVGICSHLIRRRLSNVGAYPDSPPVVPSHIPWLGHVLDFMFYRADLLAKCRANHGSTYKLRLGGRYLVIVSSPTAIANVLSRPTKVLGALTLEQLRALTDVSPARIPHVIEVLHEHVYPIVASGMSKRNMGVAAVTTSRRLFTRMEAAMAANTDEVELDPEDFITKNLYCASVTSLFGSDIFQDTYSDFSTMDKDVFAMLNRIPFVGRGAQRARKRIQDVIFSYVRSAWDVGDSVRADASAAVITQTLCALRSTDVSAEETASLLTSVLWGFHANLVRTAVACVAFLLADPDACNGIAQHVRDVISTRWPDFELLLDAEPHILDGPEFEILGSLIQETLRLTSLPTSVREVLRDTWIVGEDGHRYSIRKGEFVAADVYGLHHDAELYPEPDRFKADRFIGRNTLGTQTKPNKILVPFGGGSLGCKGREYAMYALKMFFIQLFYLYDISSSSKAFQPSLLLNSSITIAGVADLPSIHLRRSKISKCVPVSV